MPDRPAAHALRIVGAGWSAPGSVSRKALPASPSRCSSASDAAHPLGELVRDREAEARALAAAGPAVEAVEQALVAADGRSPARRPRRRATQAPSPAATVSVTSTPAGLCRRALSTSARAICATRASSAIATADARRQRRHRAAALLGGAAKSCGGQRGDASEVDVVVRDLDAAGIEPRQVEQVGREPRQARHLAAHRGDELAARVGILLVLEQLEEAAEREQRRAQLVRGVRDELAAGAVGALEPAAHVVERARQLVDLVAAVVDRPAVARLPAAIRARRALQAADAGRQRERRAAGRPASSRGSAIATAIRTSRCTVLTVRATSFSGDTNSSTYWRPFVLARIGIAVSAAYRSSRPHGARTLALRPAPRAPAGRTSRRRRCPRPGACRRGRSGSAASRRGCR